MASERPPKKKQPRREPKKPRTDLPDDDAIRQLFPAKVVKRVNDEIGHEPRKPKHDQE